jgi:hypothetical protein
MSGKHRPIVLESEGPPQLNLDGGEVPSAQARASSSSSVALSTAQQGILEVVRRQGFIRPVEAGVIVHRLRDPRSACARKATQPSATGDRYKGGGLSCCAFASTDGSAALKRLAKRGMVKREANGRAVAP